MGTTKEQFHLHYIMYYVNPDIACIYKTNKNP